MYLLGMAPLVIERGKKVEERLIDIKNFKEKGILDENSNFCFGEGGAGTFSDGKLNTGISDNKIRFVLKELIDHGAPEEIYYEGDSDTGRYIRTSNFFQEGDTVLVLDRNTPGNYTIYYKAYPEKITTATENSYELPIDDEVAVLLPLYMASQLYLDDDTTISQTYKAQFDLAFGMLANKPSTPSAETFTSESGWI